MKEDDMKSRGKKRGRRKKCASETMTVEAAEVEATVTEEADVAKEADTAKDSGSYSGETVKKKGPRKIPIPKCPEDRECCPSCQAYRDGRCAALWDVTFKDNVCPFYKEREQARNERIASMEKLEDTGREDLIQKYYGYKFDRILGNELVGISYGFDDDHGVYVDEEEISGDISEATKSSEISSSCLSEEVVV